MQQAAGRGPFECRNALHQLPDGLLLRSRRGPRGEELRGVLGDYCGWCGAGVLFFDWLVGSRVDWSVGRPVDVSQLQMVQCLCPFFPFRFKLVGLHAFVFFCFVFEVTRQTRFAPFPPPLLNVISALTVGRVSIKGWERCSISKGMRCQCSND